MNKSIFLIIFNFLWFSLGAQKITFLSSSFQELKTKAKTENKFLFIDCYTDWCGWCKVMDQKTFTDPGVISFMNEKFISAKIDMEKGQGIDLAMKYGVTGFPSYLIFSPSGKLVYKTRGYQKPPDFMKNLENSLNPLKQQSYVGISDELTLDFPEFYRNAFAGNGKRTWPDSSTLNTFFANENNLFGEVAFRVISRFDVPDNINRFFLKNIEQYRNLYSIDADDKVSNIVYGLVSQAIEEKNPKLADEANSVIDHYIKENKDELKQSYKLMYLSETSDWKNFATEFQQILDKDGYNNLEMINNYAWDIYKKCEEKSVISKAIEWMKKVIEAEPKYMFLDTYAALLYKNKNYKEAEIYAKKAIKTGKKSKDDIKETKELLAKIKKGLKGCPD